MCNHYFSTDIALLYNTKNHQKYLYLLVSLLRKVLRKRVVHILFPAERIARSVLKQCIANGNTKMMKS